MSTGSEGTVCCGICRDEAGVPVFFVLMGEELTTWTRDELVAEAIPRFAHEARIAPVATAEIFGSLVRAMKISADLLATPDAAKWVVPMPAHSRRVVG